MPEVPQETDEEKEARRSCKVCEHYDELLSHLVDVNEAERLEREEYFNLSFAISDPRSRHEAKVHPAWHARIHALADAGSGGV